MPWTHFTAYKCVISWQLLAMIQLWAGQSTRCATCTAATCGAWQPAGWAQWAHHVGCRRWSHGYPVRCNGLYDNDNGNWRSFIVIVPLDQPARGAGGPGSQPANSTVVRAMKHESWAPTNIMDHREQAVLIPGATTISKCRLYQCYVSVGQRRQHRALPNRIGPQFLQRTSESITRSNGKIKML